MFVISLLLVLLSLWLIEKDGKISSKITKRILSLLSFFIASALLIIDYGTMRGIFVLLAMLSVTGTLFTLTNDKTS
jgi:hypothetical protein